MDTRRTGPSAAERRKQAALARRLAEAGFVLPGSLFARHMRCGKPNCRCHNEVPELHGPYLQWTRTAQGKPLTRMLSADQADRYRDWFDNAHRLRQAMRELEELSISIAERDRRNRR
ncbi:MAG: DUF6788 family protein [Dermatophilaceae bacterium]